MKFFVILFLIITANNLFSHTTQSDSIKSFFFVLSSDTNYEIKSSDDTCLKIDKSNQKGKQISQKAIYVKLLNSESCKNTNQEIIIKYGLNQEFIIPLKNNKYPLPQQIKNQNTENKDIYSMLTPSGVLLLEINSRKFTSKIPAPVNSDNSKYKITFPWLCLEYCGGNSGAEIAEFSRNKDSLTSVSYERFTMDNGTWTTLNMTDPTPTILDNDLTAWPMIRSNSRTFNEDEMADNINSIWTNRETLATQMVNEAINNNYTGYCMDIEFQTGRASTRDKYMQIVDFFANKLHQSGKKLMVAHAHWATMAPMSRLKDTAVDYVATMDPYTASDLFFRKNGDETQGQAYEDYNQIEHNRLIWAFAWEYHTKSTQDAMWQWLQSNGYNEQVAGAAVWRAPAENSCKSGCNTSTQGINYYDAFEQYYPIDRNANTVCSNVTCSNHGECVENNSEPVCNCYEGYHSENLECIRNTETCTAEITCSNHGTCDDTTGIVKCNCEEGYINANLECIKNTRIKKKIIKTINSESFKISGALPYFHNQNIGLNENSLWCYQNNLDSENKMSLTFYNLSEGKYRIYTYIPGIENLSENVNYSVRNGASIKTGNINQTHNKGTWAYLGEFDAQENLEISVSCYNENSELNSFKKIYFSAIKLELLEAE